MARVLIADDDETARLLMSAAVRQLGHDTSIATNGNMAVNMFRETPYDLVIMDIAMPDRNGLLATRDLIASHPQARIIMVSGANAEQLDYGTGYGAVSTMMKPVEPVRLQQEVTRVLSE